MSSDTESTHSGLQHFLILLCVSIPSFMINLDSNIVAVSLPSIAQSLGASFSDIEWVISAYTLVFASCVMPAGALADRYGRKRMLIIGLLTFTVASFLCGAASSVAILNGSRALQGLGAAMLLSAALATLSHTFRGVQRAKAFAFWGSVIGIAISLGPVIGGFITQHFGWEWAFYINVPVGLLMVMLTWRSVEESRNPSANKIDIPGALTFSGSLFLMTLGLIAANRDGWDSPKIMAELVSSVALFVLFIWLEKRQPHPMLDMSFFRRPTYIGANIAGVSYAAGLLTMLTYLPVYFQSGLDFSPEMAGLLMLPIAVPLFLVPRIVSTQLTHRFSGRTLLTFGLSLTSAGLLWLGITAPQFNYHTMLFGLLLAGCGAGVLNGETAKVSMSVIPPERAGMASGVSGTIRFSGLVLGFAALGAVLYQRIASVVDGGLPAHSAAERTALSHEIASGNLSAMVSSAPSIVDVHGLAMIGFGAGYQAVFLTGAFMILIAAACTWWFVRSADTPPSPKHPALTDAVQVSQE
jgi:EmrB/QacA subfamily drug resistance transporter